MKSTYVYDHFYKYGEITDILNKYVKEYPGFCRLTSLGKTGEGRDIWKFELTDLSTGSFEDKPALCVTGNIHAGEVTGSMCVMYLLDYMITNLKDPEVADILKNFTIYGIPRISPDGSELYLTSPETLRSVNVMYPFDELQPGIQPADLDGDGVIRLMRVKAETGACKISEKDPRIMVKRRPDDFGGVYYNVYTEGNVLDYEGVHLQTAPAPYGNDLNRNFPANWQPENRQTGSGAYALSNVESRTMAEFVYGQKNLCAILNFHTMGGMYLYPPGCKSSKEAHKEDIDRYKEIGKMAEEETSYAAVNIKDDYVGKAAMSVVGAFDDYNHCVMGVMDYTCECWDINPRCGFPNVWPRPENVSDEEKEKLAIARVNWDATENDGKGFMNWTPFNHPVLGEVEIGGLDNKYVIQNCPVKFLPQEVEKHTRFILRYVKTLPRLSLSDVKATPMGGDNYSIEAIIRNTGYLPTYILREAIDIKKAPQLVSRLEGSVEFINGKEKEEIGHLQGFSGMNARYMHSGAATGNHAPVEKKLRWVIKAKPGTEVTVSVSSARAGKAEKTVTL